MEHLQYVIEDSTIAELLGIQNFTNDESAVLELVKNSYDAKAPHVFLQFDGLRLTITDDGVGMDANDIKQHWMHVGKSSKDYEVIDENHHKRILAGSKGIGRFALARLGSSAQIFSKKKECIGIIWSTDWNGSTLENDESLKETGTKIIINNLRAKWTKKKVQNLIDFLSKTYNDTVMTINVSHPDITRDVPAYFPEPILGKNCLSIIQIIYDSQSQTLNTHITSDEFSDEAKKYCPNINLNEFEKSANMVDELKSSPDWEISEVDLQNHLSSLGDFTAQFYYRVKPTAADVEKFLYKYSGLPEGFPGGVILYRNAFSISAYEGKKDWLELGKRSRKSPAAASHPTGSWRIRENQIAGKVEIDKKRNSVLQDLSNRQGLDENIYYLLFIDIILTGIKEFERYRQEIIRLINAKNESNQQNRPTPISDKIVSNPKSASKLSDQEAKQLATEIISYKKESSEAKREKADVEGRYKYDVRILNVLATVGLKASSIAHEMRNDRNSLAENTNCIIEALKEYGMWEELSSPEHTSKAYKNVPYLLDSNSVIGSKIVAFMNAMLSEIEKKQFVPVWQSVSDIITRIKDNWERDYAWVSISLQLEDDITFLIAEDIIQVIFDNLILNSIQQNETNNHLNIIITAKQRDNLLLFIYSDDGKGLDKKYTNNPKKILEVHETTRKNGHGLGMWIVNNTCVMSGGSISRIGAPRGFSIEFTVGGAK